MNVDEALLVADGISLTAKGSKGPDCALLVLAEEVRRQHAEIESAKSAMREYARKNPKHYFSVDGSEQDPNGVHAWLSRNDV